MTSAEVIKMLSTTAELKSATEAESWVPSEPGLYSIFVDKPINFPQYISDYLSKRQTNIIYVGKAQKQILRDHVVKQDLRGKGNSTFFRGLGAVLGFRPPVGSLKNKTNKNNYTFRPRDRHKIVEWIDDHLFIRWLTMEPTCVKRHEPIAINALRAPFNSDHNPDAINQLADLRAECRRIAMS